jgi:hypothetical protein
MSAKKIISWLLLLFGEAIIIAAFLLFRGETPTDILVLNIVVSSLVYGLFFCNFRIPWIDLKDSSQKQIGALGISWFAAWFYALLAIATMLVANVAYEFTFTCQLIIHCVLLFFLLMWMLLSRYSADRVKDVYRQETQNRSGINEMKAAMRQLKDKMNDLSELPETFTQRIDTLEDNLRFISPSDNGEAYDLERSFVAALNEIRVAVSDFSTNEERIESNLKKLERIYQNRKNIFSL